VLVDCDPDTALIDPALVEAAITPRTKAIIPVHLYGQPADVDAILAIAHPRRILVFEDACQAHGALSGGRRAGGLADGAAFSFYPGKNLGAYGEGGAITTQNADVAGTIRLLRDHGSPAKYQHTHVGWNERMDGIQGAVLGVKLRHLDGWNARRRTHAQAYRRLLPHGARPIGVRPGSDSVYHLFVVRVANRDAVQKALSGQGISTGIHYPIPIHHQPAYTGVWPHDAFPHSARLSEEILSLPMFPELTETQITAVVDALHSVL
jgi:dTDP-4-amino-4,6-dideoxygalactose transaminase